MLNRSKRTPNRHGLHNTTLDIESSIDHRVTARSRNADIIIVRIFGASGCAPHGGTDRASHRQASPWTEGVRGPPRGTRRRPREPASSSAVRPDAQASCGRALPLLTRWASRSPIGSSHEPTARPPRVDAAAADLPAPHEILTHGAEVLAQGKHFHPRHFVEIERPPLRNALGPLRPLRRLLRRLGWPCHVGAWSGQTVRLRALDLCRRRDGRGANAAGRFGSTTSAPSQSRRAAPRGLCRRRRAHRASRRRRAHRPRSGQPRLASER